MTSPRCLGVQLHEYVERALQPAAMLAWDRHVSVCLHCQGAVHAERRMIAALRAPVPAPPSSLAASLRSIAAPSAPGGCAPGGTSGYAVGGSAWSAAPTLPLVATTSPPLHRSPARAAALAGVATIVSATAACTLGLAAPAFVAVQPAPGHSTTAALLTGAAVGSLPTVSPAGVRELGAENRSGSHRQQMLQHVQASQVVLAPIDPGTASMPAGAWGAQSSP